MAINAKVLQDACMVVVFKPSCRYHNGGGYEHHPAFIYEIYCGDSASIFPDALDLKMLEAQIDTPHAKSAAQMYMHNNMAEKIAQLIEGEYNGSS